MLRAFFKIGLRLLKIRNKSIYRLIVQSSIHYDFIYKIKFAPLGTFSVVLDRYTLKCHVVENIRRKIRLSVRINANISRDYYIFRCSRHKDF
mgnify:CR=1 FL=1